MEKKTEQLSVENKSLLDAFYSELISVEGKASLTCQTYYFSIEAFLLYAQLQDKHLQDFVLQDLILFFVTRQTQGISSLTMAKDMSAMRSFGDYLVRNGIWTENFVLDVADAGLISELLKEIDEAPKNEILECIAAKNIHGLKALNAPEKIINLIQNGETDSEILKIIQPIKNKEKIKIDYSAVENLNYYNGLVFRGFIEGIPESILSGGQYDNLMKKMGRKNSRAIGFAVYLDLIRGEKNA